MSKAIAASIKSLSISVMDTISDAEAVWRELEKASDHFVFQTFDWVNLWHKCIGVHDRYDPYIVLISDGNDRPLLLLPLAIQRKNWVKRLVWLGGAESDYHGPLLAADFGSRVGQGAFIHIWADVLKSLPKFDAVFFEKQPATMGSQINPFVALECTPYIVNAHYTRLAGTWEEYYRSKRGGKTRWKTRRREKQLREKGELSFRDVTDTTEIKGTLNELFRWKSERHRETGVVNHIEQIGRKNFYEKLALDPSLGKKTKLTIMEINGQVIAAEFTIICNKISTGLICSFNRSVYQKYGIGELLRLKVLEWSFENHIEVFDFGVGDDIYKNIWCEGMINMYSYKKATSVKGTFFVLGTQIRDHLRRSAWLRHIVHMARRLGT